MEHRGESRSPAFRKKRRDAIQNRKNQGDLTLSTMFVRMRATADDTVFGRHMDQFSHDPLADHGTEDPAAQRIDTRDSLLLVAQFRIFGKSDTTQVRVRNLSAGGLMAEVPKPIDIGTMVEVDVRGVGWVTGRIAWVAAGRAGVAFDHLIDPQAARKPVVTSKGPVKDKPIKPLF